MLGGLMHVSVVAAKPCSTGGSARPGTGSALLPAYLSACPAAGA